MSNLEERIARAIAEANGESFDHNRPDWWRESYRSLARASIEASHLNEIVDAAEAVANLAANEGVATGNGRLIWGEAILNLRTALSLSLGGRDDRS